MRAVVQRVSEGRVLVDGRISGEIGVGVVVLVGVSPEDGRSEAEWLVEKIANLRIFADDAGKMNRSLAEVGGAALVVSQFTLYGDARKGRRPSFVKAAQGDEAERVYDAVAKSFADHGIETATGEFGAMMQVELVNDGPVTILLDSDKSF
jgi:D-tyrosyl-tRNA(Tyr) deacylase